MQAFHNDKFVKAKYLKRVIGHMKADELVRGATGQNGKGCAVWCTLDKYDHSAYEPELGIPSWLAHLEDKLFENMSITKSRTWPEKFLRAIPIGADLEPIKNKFLVVIVKHALKTLKKLKSDNPRVQEGIEKSKLAVTGMIVALKTGDRDKILVARKIAIEARSFCYAAASAAAAADAYAAAAASAADAAAAADAYASAAYAAAAAASAADADASAAYAAAAAAAYAASAAAAARSETMDYFADELLKLLKGAKKAGKR